MKKRIVLIGYVLLFGCGLPVACAATHSAARQLVRQFVAEELGGDLSALAAYDLARLEGHPEYGAPGRIFDADDCNLARAIYALLYADAFPGLDLSTLGTGRPYRGDTMNSFHTLLGRPIEDQPGRFAGLERNRPSEQQRAQALQFRSTYHTIGNFMPLPNRSINRATLNTYRGTHQEWFDAFPEFLVQLRLALLQDPAADDFLGQLVAENEEAFRAFRGPDGLAEFARRLDLQDYLDPRTGLPLAHYQPAAHYKSPSRAAYLAAVDRYLTVAPKLIEQRANRMIARLQPILGSIAPAPTGLGRP